MSNVKIVNAAAAGPFCVACVHANVKEKGLPPMCAAPTVVKIISLVTGSQAGPMCADQRTDKGECMPAGLLFEQAHWAPERAPYETMPSKNAQSESAAAIACPASSIDDPNPRMGSPMFSPAISSSAGATRDAMTPAR